MCSLCGLGVTNLIILLRLCGFAENLSLLAQEQKSDEVQIVFAIEPWGADSRSILPLYALKSGSVCVDC